MRGGKTSRQAKKNPKRLPEPGYGIRVATNPVPGPLESERRLEGTPSTHKCTGPTTDLFKKTVV